MVAPFGQSRALPQGAADEVALVQGAQAGHQDAREELARRCRRPAYLLALQMVGDRDDALDIAQDALLRLFESLGRFQSDRPIRPWLLTIVRNRVRDLWRRRSAQPGERLDVRPDVVRVLADPGLDPEQHTVRRDEARQVWRAIGMLSDAHREILVLRDFHDLAYAQLAHVLDTPVGTVMSRLHAARTSLRKLMKDGEHDA